MKIGILTYHRSQNYGALLQARAMQEFLKELGHDVSFVDYWPKYHKDMYKPFTWKRFVKLSWKRKLYELFRYSFAITRYKRRQKRTNAYIEKHLRTSLDREFDIVIYGSDQIWRKQHQPAFDGFNPVYWGEGYVETSHKIAYAASMGNIEIDTSEDHSFVGEHLKNFQAISIREKDLLDRLETEYGIRYELVCDPVFLLTKEHWINHVDQKYIPSYKYIFYYRLQPIKEVDSMVEELSRRTGLKIIEMRGYIPIFCYGNRYRLTADAQEFLSLLSGSEYVVSTSFHGIALSLIFQKQFFTTLRLRRAGRIKSILELLNLEQRFANPNNIVNNGLMNPIDYEQVNTLLQPFVNSSRIWLQKHMMINS